MDVSVRRRYSGVMLLEESSDYNTMYISDKKTNWLDFPCFIHTLLALPTLHSSLMLYTFDSHS